MIRIEKEEEAEAKMKRMNQESFENHIIHTYTYKHIHKQKKTTRHEIRIYYIKI